MSEVLLEIRDLKKHFKVRGGLLRKGGTVRAVDGVSFSVTAGETFALVGESGCGKTTIAKMVLMLEAPTDGAIRFAGRNIREGTAADHKAYRRQAQAVFQDPYASLNPRLRVRTIIAEPLLAHSVGDSEAIAKRVKELLDIVGLPPTAADLFPHEFSGGQRQRIAIARALALNPRFMVLDEPISALDVSIRAQILNLLADIQEEFALTYLIIAHDLAPGGAFQHPGGRDVSRRRWSRPDRRRKSLPARATPIPRRCLPPSRGPILITARRST